MPIRPYTIRLPGCLQLAWLSRYLLQRPFLLLLLSLHLLCLALFLRLLLP